MSGEKSYLWLLLILSFGLLFLNGCILLGLGVAASGPDTTYNNLTLQNLKKLKPGSDVSITLNGKNVESDSLTVNGEFVGFRAIAKEKYQELYTRWVDENTEGQAMPVLGSNIVIPGKSKKRTYEFLGFGYEIYPFILGRELDRSRQTKISLHAIENIEDSQGQIIDSKILLKKLTSKDGIPKITAIALENDTGRIQIPLYRIEKIEIVHKRNRGAEFLGIVAVTLAVGTVASIWFFRSLFPD